MTEIYNMRVNVEELIVEISSLLVDSDPGKWEKLDDDNDHRRILVTTLYAVGHKPSAIPGVTPAIIKMVNNEQVKIFSSFNNLLASDASDIAANPNDWYMSSSDADKVRSNLLPEKLRANIKAKAEKGRYTLGEAADLIEEAFICNDDVTDTACDGIKSKLLDAALNGTLPVYWPGKEDRFAYKSETSRVRDFYEEVYWFDLNTWLADNQQLISFKFPAPKALPFKTNLQNSSERIGIPKRDVLVVDWPMRSNGKVLFLKNILDDIPKWVEPAVTKCGRRGKGPDNSHLWNPAMLAVCLATRTNHKQWAVSKGALTNHIRSHFPEYLDEWNEALLKI